MDLRKLKPGTSRAIEYFQEIPNVPDHYKCLLCQDENAVKKTPSKPLNGRKKWNLLRHIKEKHKDVYDSVIDYEARSTLLNKRLKMLQNFCEIVTINGRPFAALLDSGFSRLIEDDMKKLKDAGLGITLNDKFVELKAYIEHVANEVKKTIMKNVENRFVAIMLDIASKNNRSVIGINAQYIHEGRVQIQSLGIIVLEAAHTAEYITKVLSDLLASYNIPKERVIAITTDNASAMLAMIRRFDKNAQISIHENSDDENEMDIDIPNFNVNNVPLSEGQMDTVMQSIVEMEALNRVLDDDNTYEELFEKVIGGISENTTLVTTIRCGAHSVQLIVRDGIKKSNFKYLLPLCKYISRKMRTEKFKFAARDANISYSNPSLSTEPRWDTDYLMVSEKV